MCQPLPYALSIPLLLPPRKQCVEAQSSPLEPPRTQQSSLPGSQELAGAPEGVGWLRFTFPTPGTRQVFNKCVSLNGS